MSLVMHERVGHKPAWDGFDKAGAPVILDLQNISVGFPEVGPDDPGRVPIPALSPSQTFQKILGRGSGYRTFRSCLER
jgi:hypothetical protein